MKVTSKAPDIPPCWLSTSLMVLSNATVAAPDAIPITADSANHGMKGLSKRQISAALLLDGLAASADVIKKSLSAQTAGKRHSDDLNDRNIDEQEQ
ncbi:hypothetical protein [Diaphorobacter aerolatus]|uniref:hypothetical protein n=1 Tax=Diaphorobacter aerolatus TaxID=1288495 RepID=UPI001D0204BA|nr:hypothetical protein [Diaphorobacter aerolatus]